MWKNFQPGKGPSRGLLRDCEIFMDLRFQLLCPHLDVASPDEEHVHELLQGVDEEEAGQHEDLGHGQPGGGEGAVLQTHLQHVPHVWQHVRQAGHTQWQTG